jgi:transcriptional regulator with XRE-family HTH domain
MPARFGLRELLETAGVSQSDFAREADVSFATINRLCTNATGQVSLETVDKVLTALRRLGHAATVDQLIEWEAEPKRGRRG